VPDDTNNREDVFVRELGIVDRDGDAVSDNTDNCVDVPNPEQIDTDGDGEGDACDVDDDNDGVADGLDPCPRIANEDPTDSDGDLKPDACDGSGSGNIDCSAPPAGVSAADALKVLRHVAGLSVSQSEPCLDIGLPRSLPPPDNWAMGDVDCSGGPTPVNSVDALKILRTVAGLSVSKPDGCPEVKPP
jgi:hypothetical protein